MESLALINNDLIKQKLLEQQSLHREIKLKEEHVNRDIQEYIYDPSSEAADMIKLANGKFREQQREEFMQMIKYISDDHRIRNGFAFYGGNQ